MTKAPALEVRAGAAVRGGLAAGVEGACAPVGEAADGTQPRLFGSHDDVSAAEGGGFGGDAR